MVEKDKALDLLYNLIISKLWRALSIDILSASPGDKQNLPIYKPHCRLSSLGSVSTHSYSYQSEIIVDTLRV